MFLYTQAKEKEETASRDARENTFAPRIPVFNSSKVRSRSIDYSDSLTIPAFNIKDRICSPTSASIGSRYSKIPSPINPMIALIEEEKRLKLERAQSGYTAPPSPRHSTRLSPRASPYNQKTLLGKSFSTDRNEINSTYSENTLVPSGDLNSYSSHEQFSPISEVSATDDQKVITSPRSKASSRYLPNATSTVTPVPNRKELSISEQIKILKIEALHVAPKAIPSSVRKGSCDQIPPYKATGRTV